MAVPVINPSTSVLGFLQFQTWSYQPSATNLPVAWSLATLPPGLTLDTPTAYAATSAVSGTTDVITCTGHPFVDGSRVYFPALAGGSGLVVNKTYFARDVVAGTSLTLAATLGGAKINFTTDITSGTTLSQVGTGKLSGAATEPGVYVVELTATNETGTSDPVVLTIGIEPAAYAAGEAAGLLIEINSGLVYYADGVGGWLSAYDAQGKPWPVLWAKRNDTFPLAIRFSNGETLIKPTLTSLKFGLKQNEPDPLTFLGGGPTLDTDFAAAGSTPADAHFLLIATLTGTAIDAALDDHEDDAGTFCYLLAEIEWQTDNPFTIGPEAIVRTSRTFLIAIERDLIPNE